MKSLTEYLIFNTEKRREFINITPKAEALVEKSGVKEGLCLVKTRGRGLTGIKKSHFYPI